MLSAERKAQMVQSLKKDYVVLTDIVIEVVADTNTSTYLYIVTMLNCRQVNKKQNRPNRRSMLYFSTVGQAQVV